MDPYLVEPSIVSCKGIERCCFVLFTVASNVRMKMSNEIKDQKSPMNNAPGTQLKEQPPKNWYFAEHLTLAMDIDSVIDGSYLFT